MKPTKKLREQMKDNHTWNISIKEKKKKKGNILDMEVNGQRLQESMGEEINWVHKGTPLFPYTP